jgi:hypothetical protein
MTSSATDTAYGLAEGFHVTAEGRWKLGIHCKSGVESESSPFSSVGKAALGELCDGTEVLTGHGSNVVQTLQHIPRPFML